MTPDRPIRLLYMEDDVGVARLLQKRLERLGVLVDIASDGAEGLAMYAAGTYDIVAVDQNMPVHDGLEVIRMLTNAEEGGGLHPSHPPVIMVTGAGDEKTAVEAMKLGARDYIVKDAGGGYLELLPTIVERVLNQQRLLEEKRQAETALRESEERYRLLAENSLDLIELLDLQGNLLYASPSHYRVLGYAAEALQNANIFHLMDAADQSQASLAITNLLYSGSDEKIEIRLRRQDGEWVDVEAILSGIGEGSVIDRILFSGRDITERKRAETALRQYTEELQARNEELDAFAHTVAHDLKEVASLIIGFADILERDHELIPVEEQRQYLSIIGRNGRKMNNIITELLLLASVRKLEVALKPLNMAPILAEAQNRLSGLIEEYEAVIELPESWPPALGYAPWVEEVWVNYLSNALKYGGSPPQVWVGAAVQPDGMVRFWVRDNGPGLSPEEQARLFKPFTQLERISTKGHGLGLSIVRRIVEKLGGHVGVESSGIPDEGSTFTFTLPAA